MLNVTEDHMDRYQDLRKYQQQKLKIYHQAKTAVVNDDDPLTKERHKARRIKLVLHKKMPIIVFSLLIIKYI